MARPLRRFESRLRKAAPLAPRGLFRRVFATFAVLAVTTTLTTFASTARADGRSELEKARAAYVARNYADAEERLRTLVDPQTGLKERALLSQARMNLAAVLVAQAHKEEAANLLELLMLEDTAFEPDPLSFPGDVINLFIDIRSGLQDRLTNAAQIAARREADRKAREQAEREAQRVWIERVKKQAGEETITVRNQRITAFLPFGVGQFQNKQPVLGWVFLGTEVAAIAGTVVTFPMYLYANRREREEVAEGDAERKAEQYHAKREAIFAANLAFAGAFVAIAAAGIVQANMAFVPEWKEKKPRELPPVPRVGKITPFATPLVSPESKMPNGLFVGVQGFAF